ncbi:preprotein translocase subunit SecG [Microgenomates group bacterium RBG_19FT_COMBO_39_10]|nr:MAG: preprotein translocase subunit SecG [Microgenomates group bacterium RBG_19FT_COMBO_39_10]
MNNFLTILQIVFSIGLITTILLQARGTGLGNLFGGAGGESYRSKRGVEKILFLATIGLAIGFLLISVVNIFAQ